MAIVMALSLAACAGQSEPPAAEPEAANGADAETAEGGADAAAGGDPVTLKIVYKDEGTANPVSVKFFDELEKALLRDANLNVNFELVDVPQGGYAEALNMVLMSGAIPDLIYFQGGGDLQASQQGMLEDLTPYIEKSKHLKGIMNPHNEKRLANFPYLLWVKPLGGAAPSIRTDWFNQLETSKALMENPTIENYRAFFQELVAKKPGGDKPAYAITTGGNITELDAIFKMAFGLNQTWLKKEDGTYEYALVSQKEKAKLEFYSQLYKDGLLDPQYVTKQWDTKEDAFYKGEVGVVAGTVGKVIDIYNGKMVQVNGEAAALTVLPAAKGEFQGFGPVDVTKESRGIAISAQSAHKDVAFQVLDYLASPQGLELDSLGFEGEHYERADGKIALNDKYYGEWYARFWEPTDPQFATPVETPLLGEAAQQSLKLANDYYAEDNNFLIPEQFVANWDAMNNLYKEFSTDVITGKRPISDFDAFVADWYAAGGEELTKYANETIK